MTCNCMGGNPCPCRRGAWPPGLQWPSIYALPLPPRPGWICSKCQSSNSPDAQQCPSCTPPRTALGGSHLAASSPQEKP